MRPYRIISSGLSLHKVYVREYILTYAAAPPLLFYKRLNINLKGVWSVSQRNPDEEINEWCLEQDSSLTPADSDNNESGK